MRHLLIKLTVIVLAMMQAVLSYAFTFDGPKITDRGNYGGKEFPMMYPGDFSVYQIADTPHVDAAVPQLRLLWGMVNKNNWGSATPNTYFNGNAVDNGNYNLVAVHGQFDGDGGALKDVVVLDEGGLSVCYNFNGTACASESSDVPVTVGLNNPLTLWSARISDFNGDTKDDVVVIGYDPNSSQGYVAVVAGTNGGGANPFNPDADPAKALPYYKQELKCGYPLAVTVGQFGGDAKPDFAVSTYNPCENTQGAEVHAFLNTGAGFDFKQAVASYKRNTCDKPTGLTTYNPDAAGQDDLVLTCYDKFYSTCGGGGDAAKAAPAAAPAQDNPPVITCAAGWTSGPVISLENNGANFAEKQVLGDTDANSLKYPYTSTTGDYDGDGQQDLAVASNGGKAVVTFAGTSPFQVDPASRNDIATLSYTPKFIYTHDMNSDGLPDLILTTAGVKWPEKKPPEAESSGGIYLSRNFDAIAVKSEVTGAYYTGDLAWDSLPQAYSSNLRTFANTGANEYAFNYSPNFGAQSNAVLVLDKSHKWDGVYEAVPTAYAVNRIPQDALIVLLNHKPTVSGDDPKCGGGEVTYRCTAQEGLTITECTPSTTDAAVTFSPAVSSEGGKVMSGKVKLPNDQGIHKWKVSAKDNLGTTTTAEFTADYSQCPGNTACPATVIEKQLTPKDPVMICAFENDPKLAQLNAGQTVTWAQVGTKGIDLSALTVQGQCLVGPRLPISFEKDRLIELKYSVVPGGPTDCPARMIYPKALFEGSGSLFGCSLNAVAGLASSWSLWSLLLLPSTAFWAARRRLMKK